LLEPFLYAYVLLCFKFLAKLFLPLWLKKVVQKLENFEQQQRYAQDNSWEKTSTKDEVILTLQI
jgi:hypothetical protein